MRKRIQALLIIALSIMIAVFLSACGGDGTGGRIIYGGSPDDGSPSAGDKILKWIFTALGEINSSPAIGSDGTIYVGSSNGYIYAISSYGILLWSFETAGAIDGSPAIGNDGTIYAGSFDRQVYALNPDGTLKWVHPTRSNFTAGPAIGSDGTIYIGGTDQDLRVYGCPDGSTRSEVVGYLYAINPDGSRKWRITLSGAIDSSPAIALDGTIYIGSDGDNVDLSFDRTDQCDDNSIIPPSDALSWFPVNGHLYAITPNGTIKWDFRTIGDVDSSPAIGSDGTIYVGSDAYIFGYGEDATKYLTFNPTAEGYFYAIHPNGTLIWVFDAFGDVDSSPAIGSDGTIYFGSDKNDVFALNPDGSIKWVYPTLDDVDSSPAIASDGTVYVGSDDENLYALNPDGSLKWRYETGGDVDSSPSIWSDGTIYVGSDDKNLYAIYGDRELANSPWPKFRHDLMNTGRSN